MDTSAVTTVACLSMADAAWRAAVKRTPLPGGGGANPALVIRLLDMEPLVTTRPMEIAERAIRELRPLAAEAPMPTVVAQRRIAGRQAIAERKLPAAVGHRLA